MKLLYFVLAFSSVATVTLAQKSFILQYQPKQGFISLSAGVSLPTGDFANRLASCSESGFAESGRVMNLSAGYRLVGVFGLMGRVQQQTNYMSASSVLALPYIQDAKARVATAGKWTMTSALIGPYVSLPMGRFSLDLRALAGPATAICPATGVAGWYDTVPTAVSTSQGKARSTAYNGGFTLSYRLGRSLATQFSADYSTATFTFTDMTTTTQEGNNWQTASGSGQKTISALNVQAGLTFLFGNRYRPF